MATTYKLIASSTVGSGGASNIEFTSIPGTYTDLLLRVSIRSAYSSGTDALEITFNGSTTSRSYKTVNGNGSTAGSFAGTIIYGGEANTASQTASTFSSHDIYIPNYSGSEFKSASIDSVEETNGTTVYAMLTAALWSNTSAITTVKCVLSSASNFVQYSTAYLYGIKKD